MSDETDVRDLNDSDVSYELRELLAMASNDERRVLLFCARRYVTLGSASGYARDFIDDDRDDELEEACEDVDRVFYLSKRLLRRVTRRR